MKTKKTPAAEAAVPELEEEKPELDLEAAEADERRMLDDAIRREGDGSESEPNPDGGESAGKGPESGSPDGSESENDGPAFDREAAGRRLDALKPHELKDSKGNAIYSELEVELLATNLAKLKKAKRADKDAALKRFEGVVDKHGKAATDLDGLQERKNTLSDRRSAWRKRTLEDMAEKWTLERRDGDRDRARELGERFLEKRLKTGREPWEAINRRIAKKMAKATEAGDLALYAVLDVLQLDEDDVDMLGTQTRRLGEKHVEKLGAIETAIEPEWALLGTALIVVVPKAMAVWRLSEAAS